MKPQDIIEQMVGPVQAWDQIDTLIFVITPAFHEGIEYQCANVCLDRGILEFMQNDRVVKQFAIRVTLEQVDQ